ncbi:MAG: hypothetical protein LM571_02790 [Desulfurococcaceae archaeon]|nr:hypothetical protein [Desulfurococcaceae archaeon]
MRVLDLRPRSTSCTDNPMVRFLNVVNRGEDEEVVVIANREDLPVGVLRMIASRSGYEVTEVRVEEGVVQARLRRVKR